MKRLVVVAVLAVAVALPSLALGGTFFYSGPLPGSNGGIELHIKFKHHKPRKVTRVEIHNFFAGSCIVGEDGPAEPGWKINDKAKFHGTYQSGGLTTHVTGKLKKPSNHYKKVVGTVHITSPCDSGVVDYVAKKGG